MRQLQGNRCQDFFLQPQRRRLIVFGFAALVLVSLGGSPLQGQSTPFGISRPSFPIAG